MIKLNNKHWYLRKYGQHFEQRLPFLRCQCTASKKDKYGTEVGGNHVHLSKVEASKNNKINTEKKETTIS